MSTTIAVQSTNQPQQGYNGYPQSDQIRGPDFSPWNDANAYLGRESNNAGFQSSSYHQYNNYNGNHQPTRNYYAGIILQPNFPRDFKNRVTDLNDSMT